MKATALKDVEKQLEGLDFGEGLTRDDVRRRMPNLPERIYLDLPASKRYRSAHELVHDAVNAPNRAEERSCARTSTPSTATARKTTAVQAPGVQTPS